MSQIILNGLFFKPILGVLHPSETGIRVAATTEANIAVHKVMEQHQTAGKWKQKAYTSFSDEQQAKISRYAAENSNAASLKKFKSDVPYLGESTARLRVFTIYYLWNNK